MHEAAAQPAWVLLAYLIAGVCFILALRGLSSPESSRRGNRLGMIGMAIAVVTTLVVHAPRYLTKNYDVTAIELPIAWSAMVPIFVAMAIGGGIGVVTARKIQMTAMPQLVAAFHSLVGMAAVLVGALIAAAAAGSASSSLLGLVAVALASVNIFGGFAVTQRMLAMYKKRERKDV